MTALVQEAGTPGPEGVAKKVLAGGRLDFSEARALYEGAPFHVL